MRAAPISGVPPGARPPAPEAECTPSTPTQTYVARWGSWASDGAIFRPTRLPRCRADVPRLAIDFLPRPSPTTHNERLVPPRAWTGGRPAGGPQPGSGFSRPTNLPTRRLPLCEARHERQAPATAGSGFRRRHSEVPNGIADSGRHSVSDGTKSCWRPGEQPPTYVISEGGQRPRQDLKGTPGEHPAISWQGHAPSLCSPSSGNTILRKLGEPKASEPVQSRTEGGGPRLGECRARTPASRDPAWQARQRGRSTAVTKTLGADCTMLERSALLYDSQADRLAPTKGTGGSSPERPNATTTVPTCAEGQGRRERTIGGHFRHATGGSYFRRGV